MVQRRIDMFEVVRQTRYLSCVLFVFPRSFCLSWNDAERAGRAPELQRHVAPWSVFEGERVVAAAALGEQHKMLWELCVCVCDPLLELSGVDTVGIEGLTEHEIQDARSDNFRIIAVPLLMCSACVVDGAAHSATCPSLPAEEAGAEHGIAATIVSGRAEHSRNVRLKCTCLGAAHVCVCTGQPPPCEMAAPGGARKDGTVKNEPGSTPPWRLLAAQKRADGRLVSDDLDTDSRGESAASSECRALAIPSHQLRLLQAYRRDLGALKHYAALSFFLGLSRRQLMAITRRALPCTRTSLEPCGPRHHDRPRNSNSGRLVPVGPVPKTKAA